MIGIFIFFIGLFFGSFFNVIIDRLPRKESILIGRSHCDFCHHVLSLYDLFPVLSFVFLKGKCRYCHRFIGWKYPAIEIVTGVVFVFTLQTIGLTSLPLFLSTLAVISCLLIIFFIDAFVGIIPNIVLLFLFLFTVLRMWILSQPFLPSLLAGSVATVFFLLLCIVTKGRGMGLGDVKYAFVMGLLLGFPFIISGLYVAFLTGALVSLILVVVRKKTFKNTIAFGPFLVIGTWVNIFWGVPLWHIFLHILGI